jgi:hypothetical protein
MESIQRIMIRAKAFRRVMPGDRSLEHATQRDAVGDAGMNAEANDATGKLVHHHKHPMRFQSGRFTSEQVAAPQAVSHVAEKGEPRGTGGDRFRAVMNAQDTADHVLVYFDPESQCDLLSDARAAPTRILSFHLEDGIDQLFRRSLRAGTKTASDTFARSALGGGAAAWKASEQWQSERDEPGE